MSVMGLTNLIERLPPGRARARYERRLKSAGEDTLAVTVSYSSQPLWVVVGQPQAQRLMGQGIARWRIWTLAELQDLLGACGSPVSSLSDAAEALASEPPIEHVTGDAGEK
jgi:hypothetical protein